MKRLVDTITGRTILVLFFGLGAGLFLAQYLYLTTRGNELKTANANRIAERILVLAQTITAVAVENRDDTAHGLSGGSLELHWSEKPLATPGGKLDATALTLKQILLRRSPDLATRGLIFGTNNEFDSAHSNLEPNDPKHFTLISLGLEDSSWLNITLAQIQPTNFVSPSFAISTLVGSLSILAVAILLGRWLTRPLNKLALGARQLRLSSNEDHPLEETGTIEVRSLASAINDMHGRIRRMVNDRTQMLASISHDLRTPLTRMRLRANAVEDSELKSAINRDIDEMEKMIDAALSFLREDTEKEEVQPIDLSAILQTIRDEATDAGGTVSVDAPRSLVCKGRHLALKRAITNLIDNAVKYGGSATVSAQQVDTGFEIVISDNGPGIPAEELETVFTPFHRLGNSEARETNGYGLGLSIARSITLRHGGELELENLPAGGLQVRMHLPKHAHSQ